jgi:hypothetical protein
MMIISILTHLDITRLENKMWLISIWESLKNYDSAKELYRKARLRDKNIKLDEVKEWLNKQSTHQQQLRK